MPAPILTNPPATLPSDVAGDPAAFGVAKDTWYNWYKTAWVQIATAFGWMQTTLDSTAANATTAVDAATAAGDFSTTAGNAATTATTMANDAETARAQAVTAKNAAEAAAAAAATFNPALYVPKAGGTMTAPLVQAAGTAALPSYTFTGSTSTGIYSPGANRVGIATVGVQRVEFDASGNIGMGLNNPATFGRVALSGSATGSFVVQRAADGTPGSPATTHVAGAAFTTGLYPAGMYALNSFTSNLSHWLAFKTTDAAGATAERVSIDSTGNLLVVSPALLGYGVGSGGTVTQATSKSTGVTLNKPSGTITMHNAALAAGAAIAFTLNNSLIANADKVTANVNSSGSVTYDGYSVRVRVSVGACVFTVKNETAGSLSEPISINFEVHKGATS